MVPLLGKTARSFLKVECSITIGPAIPLLRRNHKDLEMGSSRCLNTNVRSSIIPRKQKVETTQMSIDRWTNNRWRSKM